MEINKESFNMCFWKGEVCKIIVLMYEIVRESIKIMEHFWEFYPEAFNVPKSIKTTKKQSKKVHFKEDCSYLNLATSNYKKRNSRMPKTIQLPKILVNNTESHKTQPIYVKNNNFIMPKNPFKSCKENPVLLKNTIFASEYSEKTSTNCSTGKYSSFGEIKVSRDHIKNDQLDFSSRCSSKSRSKNKVNSLREIPNECSIDKNTNRTANTSRDKNTNINKAANTSVTS